MKFGLVMEGGAMRGLFTAGVIDVLMENDIEFDGAVGVSAGACFGCNYKSRQSGRAIRYNLRFCKDKRYCSVYSLVTTGDMFGAEFCYHTMPEKLDIFDYDEFNSNPMVFYVVCTDVETGRPVYKKLNTADYAGLEWIRASASMPLASRIVEVDGRKLLDGGISDSIPLSFMERHGYERNIVILTQPRDYIKKSSKSLSLVKKAYKKYPKLVKTYSERPEMYNKQLEYVRKSESEGKAFVIAPTKTLDIGHVEHNPDKLLEVYRAGRRAAMDNLDRILEFMGE